MSKNFIQLLLSALLVIGMLPTAQAATALSSGAATVFSTENVSEQKLSLKEKLMFSVFKKKAEKAISKILKGDNLAEGTGAKSSKSKLVALLLCIFLGGLGIHRFYLGYTGIGILYLFTGGLFGIGWLIDLIRLIIPNGLGPKGEKGF
jgi:TM2 domain